MAAKVGPHVEQIRVYYAKTPKGEYRDPRHIPIALTFRFKERLSSDEGIKYIASAYRGGWEEKDIYLKNRSLCGSCREGCKLKDYVSDSNTPRWCFEFKKPDVYSWIEGHCEEIVNIELDENLAVRYIEQILEKVIGKEGRIRLIDETGLFSSFASRTEYVSKTSHKSAEKLRPILENLAPSTASATTA